MKVATWNTRGLGNKGKGRRVFNLITKFQVQFMAIQETMVENVSPSVLREVWKGMSFGGLQVSSCGRSGGMISCWKDEFFILKSYFQCQYWLATFLTYIPSGIDVLIINVYAPQGESDKKNIWKQISRMVNKWNGPSCVLGDFNSTRFPNERLREELDVTNMANFNKFILKAKLIDQNIQNEMFTWDGLNGKMSRIDRILVNMEWLSLWPGAVVIAGDKGYSDHKPHVWGKTVPFWGPKPFRFFNGWFEVPKFMIMCKELWRSYLVEGYSTYVVLSKCKLLKKDLKVWSDEKVFKDKLELTSLTSRIYDLKKVQETRNLLPSEVSNLVDFKAKRRVLQRQEDRKKMFQS
ncbi:uncharacterized protein [Rutidosis leptorrhynchoides]|uniref:uncharacterized protein n=1 Tax=Rutidosis leptorrhynchoides TaxID=125765 RepID=UPI003A997919